MIDDMMRVPFFQFDRYPACRPFDSKMAIEWLPGPALPAPFTLEHIPAST